jgi:hypothetical protein
MKLLGGLFRLLEGFILFYLLFAFIKWYITGHFGKYAVLFWAFTISCFICYPIVKQHHEAKYASDYRSGQEIWNENMKNYDPVRGY